MDVIASRMLFLSCLWSGYGVFDADAYRMKHGQANTAISSKVETVEALEDPRTAPIAKGGSLAAMEVSSGDALNVRTAENASAIQPLIIAERMRITRVGESQKALHVRIAERMRADAHGYVPARLPHTIGMGVVCGFLHAVAPDHLGTLITLGTGVDDGAAFKVGASWGLGHCFGIVLLAVIVILCKQVSNKVSAFKEDWEYYGDYAVGLAMIVVGMYFILRRSTYLDQQSDGTYVLRGCACHKRRNTENDYADVFCVPCEPKASGKVRLPGKKSKPKPGWESAKLKQGSQDPKAPSQIPVSNEVVMPDPGWEERGWAGAIAGFVQGACCPTSLVGITFLAQIQASGLIIFLLCFMATTVLGTACIAVAWARLLRSSAANWLPPRLVYLGTCCLTIVLGIVWIICNYFGVLKTLEYTDNIEAR